MKVLITGAAGFIGFNLIKELEQKHKLYCLDNFSSLSKKTQILRKNILKRNKKINFKKIDLKNFNLLLKSYKNIKIDLVIHLAAQPGVRISQKQPAVTVDQNIRNFINILEFCKKKKIKNFFFLHLQVLYMEKINLLMKIQHYIIQHLFMEQVNCVTRFWLLPIVIYIR